MAPCESTCPSGIPVQERWRLVREGRVDEAVDLALAYTPFPATVCGYLCPNLCMQSCTKQSAFMAPVDITQLGKASLDAGLPELPPLSGKKIAVIGGGPAGISVAWQLRLKGHEAVIFDRACFIRRENYSSYSQQPNSQSGGSKRDRPCRRDSAPGSSAAKAKAQRGPSNCGGLRFCGDCRRCPKTAQLYPFRAMRR